MKKTTIDLRRIYNLINLINNIVDVEQNEINCKKIKFELFEICEFYLHCCDNQNF